MANSQKGFASMDPVKQKLIASKGGKTRIMSMTREERREMAAKGGRNSRRRSKKPN